MATPPVHAQKAPEAGYIFPPGAKAGQTINVQLGGYDWTPDMEFFVHDQRVQLTLTGPLGPILIAPPPYWFGAKGRLTSMPLPREVPAKLVLPANLPPVPIHWQAANANGCTSAGVFMIGDGPELIEDENRKDVQILASLPVTVSGRLLKNEEVDRYRFTAPKDGLVTCELTARRLGAKFQAVVEVHDSKGQMIADALGGSGGDPSLTFAVKAGTEYIVSLHDVDFGGDRSYVYRLTLTPSPRIVGAIPAAAKRGETRDMEFVGIGVATGTAKLESVKRRVAFPASGNALDYRLETPFGTTPAFSLPLTDQADARGTERDFTKAGLLLTPASITGVLDEPEAEDFYTVSWKKGEVWSLAVDARRHGSPLDAAVAIVGPGGKDLAKNDDLPGTTDAGLDFTVPADGTYRIIVSDQSGKSGSRAAIYRLVIRQATPDFTLTVPAQKISVPLAGKFDLAIKAMRTGGFKEPIAISIAGLPPGVTVPANLEIAKDKSDLVIPLTAAKDAGTAAGIVTIEGRAVVGSAAVTRRAQAPTTVNLAARSPEENQMPALLVATTFKPLFKGRPVDADTGRKVHRGSTFPAEVIVERLEGFQGEITLQMKAQQSYQMQGITGGEVVVPPGVTKTLYPVFMPEWLETTRTSRCGMMAIAKVTDPKGKIRYVANDISGFITMTLEGALLKVAAETPEMTVPPGQPFDVRLRVSRLAKLPAPVRLELKLPDELAKQFKADPILLPVGKEEAVIRVTPTAAARGLQTLTIRGTAMQDGKYPAVSEATVAVEFLSAAATGR